MTTKQPKVLFENDQVLVINKPAGLAVHTGPGLENEKTVVDFIRDKIEDDDRMRPGIVHRLDKDTSGVMILAKDTETKEFLQKQFKERSVEKIYIALTRGKVEPPEAILKLPIGRHRKNPMKRAVVPGGKMAETHYETVESFGNMTLLELHPKTGRTHQIRVQLADQGYPLVGDRLYGKKDPDLNRHFLHAHQLKIKLPTGSIETFEAELAPKLQEYLQRLSNS